jgi:hypothetical protein
MRPAASLLATLLLFSLLAQANDQQKADKEMRKLTAMSADATARRMVSMSLADTLKINRALLTQQRRVLNLSYGNLFLLHQLLDDKTSIADIAAALRSGKDLQKIASDHNANWKTISQNAKKMNDTVEDKIYRHFLNDKNTQADDLRDFADKYDPDRDLVKADAEATPQEISDARDRYVFWRNRASVGHDNDRRLGLAEENAAYADHVRGGGPQGNPGSPNNHGVGAGASAPTAGGAPPQ